ncbi:MAG TPA: hypothetical protein DGT23_26850 [Micromonosporaceae bacterium]|nr:hypothetical protein [Micromonosporaceae bacterium]
MPGQLDWQRHGLQPRWLGMESSDCAVAIEPGHSAGRGDDERDRFLAGAARRGELALLVTVIGDVDDDSPRSVLSRFDASVHLSDLYTTVYGRRMPAGTRPTIAPDLSAADRDLAIRMLNRPPDAPWWSLKLSGATTIRGDGFGGEIQHEAKGQLEPILVDALGDPLVAAWVSPAGDQRWYIIPDVIDWNNVLGWLTHDALPAHAPGALRRARSPHFVDPDLQTDDELTARLALSELEERHAEERADLQQAVRAAEQRAETIRYGLLYGTGSELVEAVAAVMTAAGLHAVDLDEVLGGTKSADLLVSADRDPPQRLVEIKAAGGAAQESLVGHLQRHLDTWPQLRPDAPVTGGVLVVNHQHKLHPSERTLQVYSRPEFVASLPVTVLSTMELFGWWRVGDWEAIRTAILGADATATPGVGEQASTAEPQARQKPTDQSQRWWRRRSGTA